MLRNYWTVALRALRRHPGYTAINVVGLAVGIGACLLIGLYVRHELSYDSFHAKGDRIYRVDEITERSPEGSPFVEVETGPALSGAIPDIEHVVRMDRGPDWMQRGNDVAEQLTGYYAGPAFFDIFSFDLVAGQDSTALQRPGTVVLTDALAARLFGRENPIGQSVTVEVARGGGQVTAEVTGVVEEVPSNSHFTFDYLLSMETLRQAMGRNFEAQEMWTYVLLEPGTSPAVIDASVQQVAENYAGGGSYRLDLRPLTSLYFDYWTPRSGDWRYVYLFSAIALGILLIAAFNYMNLATARATRRAREVGVRKTLGAHRKQLAGQFFGESLLLTLLALPLALGLVAAALPAFNALADTQIAIRPFADLDVLGLLLGVTLVAGLLAGSYPALFLSRFRPVEVLRKQLPVGQSGGALRKALIVLQFAVSAALIFGTGVIWQQLQYVQEKKLGFDQERVVTVPLKRQAIAMQADAMQQEMARLPGVRRIASSVDAPSIGAFGGSRAVLQTEEGEVTLSRAPVDASFLETLDIRLLAGRNVTAEHVASEAPVCLLNRTAVEAFGWSSPEEALGKTVGFDEYEVIGVVQDFHFRPLHEPITPLRLEPSPRARTLVARLAPGDVEGTLDQLRSTWQQFAGPVPFEYHFLDQQIERLYRQEQRTAQIFSGFAGLAILLACLGLFGLAAYLAERRTQEIGIRKALGASARSIVLLLSKEFMALVAVACLVAAPVAYYGAQRWLADFAYRIDLGPGLFAGAAAGALLLALAAVSTQAWRAAQTDPARAIRQE
jgi:putative ABC transport system permease protein